MAFQRVPNTAEIDIIYTQNGQTLQNTFFARFGGIYSPANLQALATAVDLYVGLNWLPLQTNECTYAFTEVRGLNAENDFVASDSTSLGPGGDIAESLPTSVTLAIKKSSGLTGRSARGRTYWIGLPVNKLDTNENLVLSSYSTSVVAAVDGLRGAINGAFNWQAVLVSRFALGVKRAEGVTFDWTSTSVVNNIVDTQRGRLP